MCKLLSISKSLNLFLKCNSAQSGPPLGTILGNLGVNTVKFCNEFNEFTKNLPVFLVVKVNILIYENRSFSFKVFLPSTGFLLSIFKFKKVISIYQKGIWVNKDIYCITIKNLLKIALIKFPTLPLSTSFFMMLGSIKSLNVFVLW